MREPLLLVTASSMPKYVYFTSKNTCTDELSSVRAPSYGKPLREKIMLIVYYRYCGSRVETLKTLAAAVSPSHWVKVLNALPEGTHIIRTDAYHASWGTAPGELV